MKIMVTGGAGFIGSAFVRKVLADTDSRIVNMDKLTYASSPESLAEVAGHPRYDFERGDISDRCTVSNIIRGFRPDAIVNLAAETNVDRSIDGPADFIQTNVLGAFCLLECTMEYWQNLDRQARERFRFLHVSTDEVFGSLGPEGSFCPDSPYRPNSPYAASKAAADHLVRAWFRTYGLPTIVTNSSNNYGPFQFPEKLIPVVITKALTGQPIPIYGGGENVRDWIFVDDHVEGLLSVLSDGRPGENYNLSGSAELSNLDVVRRTCRLLDELKPNPGATPYESLMAFVADRPGHDFRYALDTTKTRKELFWRPRRDFGRGLRETVGWYLENEAWRRRIASQVYGGERLGLSRLSKP